MKLKPSRYHVARSSPISGGLRALEEIDLLGW
jgi:hypothetical protein